MAFSTYQHVALSKEGKRFWNTKKKQMTFVVDPEAREVELNGAYWSGGTKSEWYTVTKSGVWTALPCVGPSPFDNRAIPKIAPTADVAVVECGWFCGKVRAPYAHVISTEGWKV